MNNLRNDGLLIVDDEIEILNSLRRIFRRHWNVFVAHSAQNALQILQTKQVAVVLSDQRMPEMTGVELLSRLKRSRPEIITLLLTGYADIEAVIDAINKGEIYRYITKPCDPDSLAKTIKDAMEKYNLQQDNKMLLRELQKTNQELEQKVIERTEELKKSNDHLEQINKSKNEFLGMAAHDLRSPLSGLLSVAKMLSETGEILTEKRIKLAKLMSRTCEDMLNLINNFLDVSKIESGTLQLSLEKVSAVDFFNTIALHNRMINTRDDVKLDLNIEPDAALIVCDPHRIKQVCNNLITNAYKFAAPNTSILFTVSYKETHIEITINNKGVEINKDEINEMFLPFSQLSTGKKHFGSVGLGLSICRRLIEMHGGEISMSSSGGTTSFLVTLPIIEMHKNE